MPPKSRSKDALLKELSQYNADRKAPTLPLSKDTKFIQCDGCGRVITFVFFRTAVTNLDFCNGCRLKIESCGRIRILGKRGAAKPFQANDVLSYMGKAPKAKKYFEDSGDVLTEDEEVNPQKCLGESKRPRVISGGKVVKHIDLKRPREGDQHDAEGHRRSRNQEGIALPPNATRGPPLEEDVEDRPFLLSQRVMEACHEAEVHQPDAVRTKLDATTSPPMPSAAPRTLSATEAVKREAVADISSAAPALLAAPNAAAPNAAAPNAAAANAAAPNAATPNAATPNAAAAKATPAAPNTAPAAPKPAQTAPKAALAAPNAGAPKVAPSRKGMPQGKPEVALAIALSAPSTTKVAEEPPRTEAEEMILNGPVTNFFRRINSLLSHKDIKPEDSRRPFRLHFSDDAGFSACVQEGTAIAWQNGFVGLSRRIAAASFAPTRIPTDGLWLSTVCEDEYKSTFDVWRCKAIGSSLEPPVKQYSVSLGVPGVIAMSWVPCPLPMPTNTTLGVCTILRPQLLLSCQLPRKDFPSETLHLQIAGAQQIRIASVKSLPADLKWHTTYKAMSETYLFVVFRCSAVAVYQSVKDPARIHLVLAAVIQPTRLTTPMGPSEPSRVLPHYLRCPAFACGTTSNDEVFVGVGCDDCITIVQSPKFEIVSFSRLPSSTKSTERPTVTALLNSSKGEIVMASETSLHSFHFKLDQREITSCFWCPTIGLYEVRPSVLVASNCAGQLIQVRTKYTNVEVKSILWIQRGEGVGAQGSQGAPSVADLYLQRHFDGTLPQPTAKANGAARTVFHTFGKFAMTFFGDGAFVVYPCEAEKK